MLARWMLTFQRNKPRVVIPTLSIWLRSLHCDIYLFSSLFYWFGVFGVFGSAGGHRPELSCHEPHGRSSRRCSRCPIICRCQFFLELMAACCELFINLIFILFRSMELWVELLHLYGRAYPLTAGRCHRALPTRPTRHQAGEPQGLNTRLMRWYLGRKLEPRKNWTLLWTLCATHTRF